MELVSCLFIVLGVTMKFPEWFYWVT